MKVGEWVRFKNMYDGEYYISKIIGIDVFGYIQTKDLLINIKDESKSNLEDLLEVGDIVDIVQPKIGNETIRHILNNIDGLDYFKRNVLNGNINIISICPHENYEMQVIE